MSRPTLTPNLSAAEFGRYYWLKEELTSFCRHQQLPTSGSKQELTHRIARYLAGESLSPEPAQNSVHAGSLPITFTRASVIGPGWRCSQGLRAFFEREIGPGFHFDPTMRELIHHGNGQTLGMAIQSWEATRLNPPSSRPIAGQFEYNQHIRDYFQAHPGASLQDAIRAWKEKKNHANPRSQENL